MRQTDVKMKRISDTNFYITPFSAFTAARVSGELSKVLGPMLDGLGPLLDEMTGTDDTMDISMDSLLPAIGDALGQLDGESLERLAKLLMVDYKNVAYENEDGDVERLDMDAANEVFCEDLWGMILLGWEVVKINFGGFFGKMLNQFGALQKTTTPTEKSLGTRSGATST